MGQVSMGARYRFPLSLERLVTANSRSHERLMLSNEKLSVVRSCDRELIAVNRSRSILGTVFSAAQNMEETDTVKRQRQQFQEIAADHTSQHLQDLAYEREERRIQKVIIG